LPDARKTPFADELGEKSQDEDSIDPEMFSCHGVGDPNTLFRDFQEGCLHVFARQWSWNAKVGRDRVAGGVSLPCANEKASVGKSLESRTSLRLATGRPSGATPITMTPPSALENATATLAI
jgi:hypothetical protein